MDKNVAKQVWFSALYGAGWDAAHPTNECSDPSSCPQHAAQWASYVAGSIHVDSHYTDPSTHNPASVSAAIGRAHHALGIPKDPSAPGVTCAKCYHESHNKATSLALVKEYAKKFAPSTTMQMSKKPTMKKGDSVVYDVTYTVSSA